jgi:hypothetical protein
MDQEFAGTQLYIQRVIYFFLPLCLLALYQHNQCGFFEKVDKKICFYFLTNLIDFTPFSNFYLLIFSSGKDSFIKSIFSLSLSLSLSPRRKKSTGRNQEEKSWREWGLNP